MYNKSKTKQNHKILIVATQSFTCMCARSSCNHDRAHLYVKL